MVNPTTIIEYTHEDFLEGVQKIVSEVRTGGWLPNYIVGVVRGGAVPAVYLSHRLKVPVVMVHWNTRDKSGDTNESNCWIPEEIQNGAQVLIVDDIVDGGETIKQLLADWQKNVYQPLRTENIKIAALIYNTAQDVTVDFYHRQIDRNIEQRWFCFPWEG